MNGADYLYAFPSEPGAGDRRSGMTLRDYFAAKAMQGMLASNMFSYDRISNDAEIAYQIADAMLKEREK